LRNIWRKILFTPFSLIYGSITGIRNWLFDRNILSSKTFDLPIISVGNLAVGGTGKTPHVEFLLSFLKADLKIAVLSRGYKRKTKGFLLADSESTYNEIGDEPFQIAAKNLDVIVAVDEKRVDGVNQLIAQFPELQTIILDDAFQHRQIKPGLSILLTDINNMYTSDSHLPGGNLRERRKGAVRADMIVITKCPLDLKPIEIRLIEKDFTLKPYQSLFFSSFEYSEIQPVFPESIVEKWDFSKISNLNTSILLITGIVSPLAILEYLQKYSNKVDKIFYPDHYNFQKSDFIKIEKLFSTIQTQFKLIIVTEKDAARLISNPNLPATLKPYLYVIPIKVKILNNQEEVFKQKITNYVNENSRNG